MRWLDGITGSMDMSLQGPGVGDGQENLLSIVHSVTKIWTRLSNGATTRIESDDFTQVSVNVSVLSLLRKVKISPGVWPAKHTKWNLKLLSTYVGLMKT